MSNVMTSNISVSHCWCELDHITARESSDRFGCLFAIGAVRTTVAVAGVPVHVQWYYSCILTVYTAVQLYRYSCTRTSGL